MLCFVAERQLYGIACVGDGLKVFLFASFSFFRKKKKTLTFQENAEGRDLTNSIYAAILNIERALPIDG